MAGKEPETGPTAKTVAANVKRLRTELNLNYTQVSERLQQVAGWSINAVGIRRIESGERRVTPDDLVALAMALGVWPITLLMPDSQTMTDKVTATGLSKPVDAVLYWGWLTATIGIRGGNDEWVETMHNGHPRWLVRKYYQSAYEEAVEDRRRLEEQARGDD